MTDLGKKYDGGKTDPTLLMDDCTEAVALIIRVLDYGFAKYQSRGSWKKVPNAMQRYDAAKWRHALEEKLGYEFDDESGLIHEAHEATNAIFRLQMRIEGMIEAAEKMAPGGGTAMWEQLRTFNPPPTIK